jgi:hypothetical protein
MDNITFHKPVEIGSILVFDSKISYVHPAIQGPAGENWSSSLVAAVKADILHPV